MVTSASSRAKTALAAAGSHQGESMAINDTFLADTMSPSGTIETARKSGTSPSGLLLKGLDSARGDVSLLTTPSAGPLTMQFHS